MPNKEKNFEILSKSFGILNLSSLTPIPPSILLSLKSLQIPQSSSQNLSTFLTNPSQKTLNFEQSLSQDIVFEIAFFDKKLIESLFQYNFWQFVEPLVSYKKSWGKSVSVASVMSFSKSSTNIPLLSHIDSKEKEIAKRIFSLLKKFLLIKDHEDVLLISMKIVNDGFYGSVNIRDELFLQIVKQLNNNPDKGLRLKLYKLLAIIGSTFPVSVRAYSVILSFLFEILQDLKKIEPEEELRIHAKFAINRIYRTFETGGKSLPPLEHEIREIWLLKTIPIHISFLNNKTISICIESWSQVKTAIFLIEKELNMKGLNLYLGLFIRESLCEDRFLEESAVLLEELTKLAYRKMTDNSKEYRLYAKLKFFPPNFHQENLKDMMNLIYLQFYDEFLKGVFPCKLDDIVHLASISLYIEKGRPSYDKLFNFETSGDNLELGIDIANYLPKGSITKDITKQYLLVKILNKYLNNKEEKEGNLARLDFCNYLKRYDEFMGEKFIGRYSKVFIRKGEIEESFNEESAVFCRPFLMLIVGKTTKNKAVFHYKEIEAFGALKNPKGVFAFRTFDLMIHLIECEKAKEIERVVEGYLGLLKEL